MSDLEAVESFSTYNVRNGYFKDVSDGGGSNNLLATAVFELNNGDSIQVFGKIYSKHKNGGQFSGMFWKPLEGRSRSINGYTVSNAAGGGATSYGICVQLYNKTISVSQTGNSLPSIGGDSSPISITDLNDYVATYPNVTTQGASNINNSSVLWGGSKLANSTSFSVTEAGVYFSTNSYVSVGTGTD
jgi:hypothetical protein